MIKSLGDYNLLKKLGVGTLGEVYLAEHRFLKKSCVVKILPEDLSSDLEFVQRFEKEVNQLATLDHPSIVKVHNISNADGRYFLVTDAITNSSGESINLDRYLRTKGQILSEAEVEMILKQIASALDSIHKSSAGFVHRSLKLTNVLVQEGPQGLKVMLTDSGLSRLVGEGRVLLSSYERLLKELSGRKTLMEHFDKGMSSFASYFFLAPEQKRKEEVTFKADVYSFGVLAYYLLTRDFPEGCFDLPSGHVPNYKLNWDALICRCLQKDPSKRPNNLTEAMNIHLSAGKDATSLEVVSWKEIGKKVENAMQLSFEFTADEKVLPPVEVKEESPKPQINPPKLIKPNYSSDPGAIFQKDLQVSHYTPKKVEAFEVEPILTEMVIIPGGAYMRGSTRGSRDEIPRHLVKIASFALDIHCITNEQFARFLEAMGGEKDANNNDIIRLKDARIKRSGGKLIIESGYAKHPVVGVTWYGAMAYSEWIGKRLPTEAEWEISAMGGIEDSVYPTGPEIDHKQANFFSSDTTAVMSFPPNGYGLYDTVGNVYEWCQDWYAYNYYETSLQEPENPKGPLQGVYRVLRGGCWKSLKEDLRCAHRHRNNPGAVNSTYGFRCATDVS